MKAFLVHQGVDEALSWPAKLPTTLTKKENKDILSNGHKTIIPSLGDR